ncbi:PKD domain-containing protein [Desulfobulbus oligotrophicus]|uniref:PKD domain-containing protein n=1 Tax=Desulfobulbus oligotrophicus TaxID=1909699 RepID=A0A7T5VB79_9BACT|nr:PKD domain-containing protein [Desulfobulbus oligotrophicus]QQG64695.1 PKD domain-containing protein [Desulfobulbus oligotrophicus]
MHRVLVSFLLTLFFCMPTWAFADSTHSIRAEWSRYSAPTGLTVAGFNLYQDGELACQTQGSRATSLDCTVSLKNDSPQFTLTAAFTNGTESSHSAPFAFTPPSITPVGETATIRAQWTRYTAPSGYTTSGYNLYMEGVLACQTQSTRATSLDCTVSLPADRTSFTLTAAFTNGAESAHSEPFTYTKPNSKQPPTAAITASANSGTAPVSITFNGSGSTAGSSAITSYSWNFGDGATASGSTASHEYTAAGTYTTTLTVTDQAGLTNLTSTTVVVSAPSNTTTLNAVISTSGNSGQAPLTVSFNGSSSTAATGNTISSYSWDFGDGTTATGATASHAYTSAGTYTATLTITDNRRRTNSTTTTIVVSAPANTNNSTLAAVISTSSAVGPAPLTVSFDGSASTAASGNSIRSYSWDFGDGTTASGASTSHAYTSAGTYTATLTITDNRRRTHSTSTPIVVSAPANTNKAPSAVVTATPTTGTLPLTVTFDGSGSSDSDGRITSYIWDFGNGSTASGANNSHTYTAAGTYTASLTVTDNNGARHTANTTIVVEEELLTADINLEAGEVEVTNNWVFVRFTNTFNNPIVIAGPPSINDADPTTVRIRNVSKTGFQIRMAEWDYLDGEHYSETVRYLVMEKGRSTLSDGTIIEAGSFAGTSKSKNVSFTSRFNKTPVVVTTVATENGTNAISGRINNITQQRFSYYFQEQEKNSSTHVNETVHYIAWEPGQGTVGSMRFEVGTTGNVVTNAWYTHNHQSSFGQAPFLLADMQTTNDTDTAALRVRNTTANSFGIKVEEERSRDYEVSHGAETVGYIAIGQAQTASSGTSSGGRSGRR